MEEYVVEYPALGPSEELPDELIVAEYRARHRWGDKPSHNEYLTRFGTRRGALLEALARTDEDLGVTEERRFGSEGRQFSARANKRDCTSVARIATTRSRSLTIRRWSRSNVPPAASSFNLAGDEALAYETVGGHHPASAGFSGILS